MFGHKELLIQYREYQAGMNYPSQPALLYEPVSYILSLGGKCLRPVLTLLAGQLARPADDRVLRAAYGIELFHNFSLIHDDIMDHAPLRRGQPTVHKKWDEATGILSGDQMLIMAFTAMRMAGNDLSILQRFEQMATEVCEGQRMDMDFSGAAVVYEKDYIEMIRKKTAVLIGFSLWAGGKISGLKNAVCEQLYHYGVEAGIGFQIMDDVLDCYGGEGFGKNTGGDILEGKKTLLYLRCCEKANEKDRIDLNRLMESSFPDQEKIAAVLAIYDRYNIRTSVETTLQEKFDQADAIGETLLKYDEVRPEGITLLKEYLDVLRMRKV